jgi:hypothetical protein
MTGIAMKTPSVNNALIFKNEISVQSFPLDSVMSIDVEFYSSYGFENNKKFGINYAARIPVMTKSKSNLKRNKSEIKIIFHCLLNMNGIKFS